eukprot:9472863-Pyramimonas_sp.AAC.1
MDSVAHRCPLFKQEWGTSPATTMAIDSLHTVYYGPITRWASTGLWRLIKLNPWKYTGDKDTVYTKCCQRIEADMFTWFDQKQIAHDRRLGGLTIKMLGSDRGMMDDGARLHPGTMLKAKAAESRVLMDFTRWELEGKGAGMPLREPLLAAATAMDEWLDVFENADT